MRSSEYQHGGSGSGYGNGSAQHQHEQSHQSQTQPRAIPPNKQHHRNKAKLSINVFDANDYSTSPDYDDYPALATPLSPPPPPTTGKSHNHTAHAHAHAQAQVLAQVQSQSPTIPVKSSQRSLRSAKSPICTSPSSAQYDGHGHGPGHSHAHNNNHNHALPNRNLPLPISSSSRPEQQAQQQKHQLAIRRSSDLGSDSPPRNKVFAQSSQCFSAAQERNAPTPEPRLSRSDRSQGQDTFWDSDPPRQTFLDTFSTFDNMSKHNDLSPSSSDPPSDSFDHFDHFDSRPRRDSRTPPPSQGAIRDSHDLSLSPRNVTRDSLLGNMLLSLDQFSMGQVNCAQAAGETRTMSGFAEPAYYYEDPASPARGGVAPSKTMTSVSSKPSRAAGGGGGGRCSDYETADDSTNRMAHNVSRRRRSNSSSTPGLHSTHKPNQRSAAHGTVGQRGLHSRGGRGSKSSSASSMDGTGYASVFGSQRWAHGTAIPTRSSSLELARRKDSFGTQPAEPHPQLQHQHQHQHRQPWNIDFANSNFDPYAAQLDDYMDDAAPTPTVPAGPRRRLSNMPSMPSFGRSAPMGEPLSPVRSINLHPVERKRSNKSARSTATRQSHHSTRFNSTHERDIASPPPPLPGSFPGADPELADSAPAPHIGYEKAKDKEPVHMATPTSAVSQPKEKQGFFRRMFGGASKSSLDQNASTPSPTDSYINSPVTVNRTMSSSTNNIASVQQTPPLNASPVQPTKSASNPPSRQTNSSHGLQKKPSGFFRRRKKSVSVNAELPPLPPVLPPMIIPPAELPPPPKRLELLTPRLAPSPVTSLRKAMDPYLNAVQSATSSAIPSPQDGHTLSSYHSAMEEINHTGDGQPRSFSPDYEPDPRATIRSVKSEQKIREHKSLAPEIRRPSTPTRDFPKPPRDYERTGSFLHDNSDSEGSPQWIKKRDSQSAMQDPSSISDGNGRTVLAPIQTNLPLASSSSNVTVRDKKLDRLTQDSISTNATDRPSSLQLPIEGARTGPALKTRISAASIPSLKIEDSDLKTPTTKPEHPLDEPDSFVVGDPTEDDRAKAQGIFDGNEDFIPKEKAASWMGEEGPIRQRTLRAYMDLYDFTNKNIVTCLREVCNRLVLRAETQQVDRILVTFSRRWVDCNPNHGFKSTGKYSTAMMKHVIHTICYSIMLLNTDLHMADIESKMTRSQFVKNTMGTVRRAAVDSVPEAFDRPSILPGKGFDDARNSVEHEKGTFRNSFIRLPGRAGSALGDAPTELDDCGPLVKAPFEGSLKAWESQMEIVLKEIYSSIRDERLPLFGAEQVTEQVHSAGGLSVIGMLKRSPSVLSKAASENPSTRGRGPDSMLAGNSRWASKSRSRPRGFGSAGFSSSRTSFDDGQSMWSPVESVATWSRASLGRTHTSMSMDSFGSRFPRGDYQQSIGFANALSQAIIREDPRGSVPSLVSDELKTTQLLDDESLELAGPPWVKEGIVMHKHHLDGVDRKAKDRNWVEVFCVIQKGNVSIFSFTPNKSMGRRSRNAAKKGGVVGGGNWQENATTLGTWNLRLCLASALPPPGYSKQRPHVWALSLPTGAVHLFHVGTPEICNEFVTTANYWSARLSTHPLVGGVSNVEYGWSDAIINNALITAINENSTTNVTGTIGPAGRQRSGSVAATRSSMHSRNSSFRSVSSFDFGSSNPRTMSGLGGSNKLPGDIVTVAEWRAPTQSMRPSNASEKEQLKILLNYVKSIEEDLQQHNALRSPMLLAFTPRGSNAQKAMANWERRSAYLLREIVKFRTYTDVLQLADARKVEIYRERDVARRAAIGGLDADDALSFDDEEDDALEDGEEPDRGRAMSREGVEEEEDMTLRP
ncbi:hypothetical protein N0V93_008084 [Gnomoniopsis smithogilvyi]|uniref:SEC7 domain-containing protein n=1 Tax=Gnomoniopsis smithogilvyi TaxID=1191159 RepID=A0A9W8YPN7_9PEZI|nr:hypothetical protein N0V93_008084 [Gnomoniopsis smithogilvyi]